MKSKPIDWSHLMMLIVLTSLHRCSHAQPGTSTTWAGSTLKDALTKTHFSIIVIAFLSSIVFLIFFSLFIRHCVDTCAPTNTHPNTDATDRRRREAVDKCPVLVYSEVKELRIGNSPLECAVCLGEFQDTDKIRLLPKCNHVFHPDCIDRWFASRLTCPVCRAKLTLSDFDDNADAVTTESNRDESPVSDAEIMDQQSTEESPEPQPEETIEVDDESGSTGVPAQTETRSRTAAESFERSYSTGHSLIMESEGLIERYTLRLPEYARGEIFGREERNRLRRCASSNDVVLRGEWNLKNGSDNMERWVLQSMTPPFVSKNWSSVKFMRPNTDQSSSPPPSPRPPV